MRRNAKGNTIAAVIDSLCVSNFRCFGEEQRAAVRPITLLVGENSTGKTALLGAYRALHGVLSGEEVDFNRSPIKLGAFSNLVYKGAGKEFSIGCSAPGAGVAGKTVFTFSERGGSAAVSAVRIEFGEGGWIRFALRGGNRVQVTFTGGGKVRVSADLADFRDFSGLVERLLHALSDVIDLREGSVGWDRCFEAGDVIRLRDGLKRSAVMKGLRPLLQDGFNAGSRPGSRSRQKGPKCSVFPRPRSLPPVVALAPARTEPRRTYCPDREGGLLDGDFDALELLRLKKTEPERWDRLNRKMTDFGKKSGMFTRISVKDCGGLSDPFRILVGVRHARQENLVDVGYGVSQALPALVELLREGRTGKTVLLQHPEANLHPRGQVELASLMVETCRRSRSTFLVETHSDFIVDRVSIEIRKGRIKRSDVSLLYFEPDANRGVRIHGIPMGDRGEPVEVPPNYREFYQREMSRLLGFE